MFKLKVITPTSTITNTLVESVSVPTGMGMITVLNHRIPLVSSIEHGELTIRKEGEELTYAVSNGVVNVYPHKDGVSEVVILIEDIEKTEAVDQELKAKALLRARELAEEKAETFSFGGFESRIERELSKVKFSRRK